MVFEETVVLQDPFDQVVEKVKAEFASQGFGVLTEIDFQATLEEKTGKSIERYQIIGACNPYLAARALAADPQIGVLLPCNVVVRASGDDVIVEALDAGLMASLSGNPEIGPIADEARQLISNALVGLSPNEQLERQ